MYLPSIQLPTLYGFSDIILSPRQNFKGHCHYSKIKGQIMVTPCCFTPITPNNVPTKYELPTPYGFRDIARARFYRSRSQRQGQRSHHVVSHLQPLQLPTPYSFRDTAWTNFLLQPTEPPEQKTHQLGQSQTVHSPGGASYFLLV